MPRAPALLAPLPASLLELVVVWAWHTPLLHTAARESAIAFAAEQGSFLLSGLVLWIAAFGSGAAGVVALLLTAMHMTLLGALLALSPRALYMHHAGSAALADLHLGGAIMILVGGVSYLAGGLWLSSELVRGVSRNHGSARAYRN